MYESPQSDLTPYQPQRNCCPKCQHPVSLWDYTKPRAGMPNTMQCRNCSSILRYNIGKAVTVTILALGFVIALLPAYFFWDPDNLLIFGFIYLPYAVILLMLSSIAEAMLVRKFYLVEFVEDGPRKEKETN